MSPIVAITLTAALLAPAAPAAPARSPARAPLLTQMELIAGKRAGATGARPPQAPRGGDPVKDGALNGAILGGLGGWWWSTRNGMPPALPAILGTAFGALIGAELDALFDRQ